MSDVLEPEVWVSRLERGSDGLRIRGPADPFVEALARTKRRSYRLFIAERALARDEDCIEANLVVAAHCDNLLLRLCYLYTAVDAGDRHWNSPLAKSVIGNDWANVPGARPWMQAIKALGEALEEHDDLESARDCYRRLLEMDPSDFQGVRAHLDRIGDGPLPMPSR